jgi:hypothetical protein
MAAGITSTVWMTRDFSGCPVLGCACMATNPPPPLPINCAICGKPILPKDFNVTEAGKPVHGECWLTKVQERKSQQR